jgi:phosphate transport system substrate-binding protein
VRVRREQRRHPSDGETGATGGDLSGVIAGAGASSQAAAMEGWIAGFQGQNEGVTVNYDPVGSSGGREQFLSGGTLFAGSDSALKDEELATAEERCGAGGLIEVPLYISPIAVAFNLEGIDTLNLSPEVIAGIFAQQITQWNAPEIAADNPTPSSPTSRSRRSTARTARAPPRTSPSTWLRPLPRCGPTSPTASSRSRRRVGAGHLRRHPGDHRRRGAITYADASQVGELGTVAVGVGEEFVEYSPEAAASLVEGSPASRGRPEGSLALELARDTAESGNYPIVLVSYSLACKTYEDAAEADLVKGFLTYIASEEGQEAATEAAGSAPITDTLRTDVMEQIEQFTAPSRRPSRIPRSTAPGVTDRGDRPEPVPPC